MKEKEGKRGKMRGKNREKRETVEKRGKQWEKEGFTIDFSDLYYS